MEARRDMRQEEIEAGRDGGMRRLRQEETVTEEIVAVRVVQGRD